MSSITFRGFFSGRGCIKNLLIFRLPLSLQLWPSLVCERNSRYFSSRKIIKLNCCCWRFCRSHAASTLFPRTFPTPFRRKTNEHTTTRNTPVEWTRNVVHDTLHSTYRVHRIILCFTYHVGTLLSVSRSCGSSARRNFFFFLTFRDLKTETVRNSQS